MKIKDLKPAGYNPRKITDEKLQMLKKALEEFGDLSGIVFNRQTGNLIGGHQRLKCLPPDAKIEKTKLKKPSRTGTIAEGYIILPFVIPATSGIPQKDAGQASMTNKNVIMEERYAYREVDWPIEKEKAANIAANKQGGEFDDELLSALIKELSEIPDFDTDLLGFDDSEITTLLNSITKEGQIEDDEVPEVPEKPITKTGDFYILGNHRLLCGDATKKEDVDRLMDGEKADMVFTDPPYGVNYDGGHAEKGKRRNKLKNDNTPDMFTNSFPLIVKNSKHDCAFYIWYSDSKSFAVIQAVIQAKLEIRNHIIWNKQKAQFGAIGAQYKSKHEPCLYMFKKGKIPQWFGPNNEISVWDVSRTSKNEYHPTQKPVELAERAIKNSSKQKDIILDLFLGSGSTLIACEKTGRICYGMEIDPHYCDVIVTRYCNFTGNNKIIKNGKEIKWPL